IFALLRTTTSSPGNERLIAKSSNSGDYSLALQRSEGSDKLLATMANQTNVVAQYAHENAISVAGDVRCVASIWNDRTLYFYRDGLLVDQQAVDNSSILTAPATEQGWLIGGELRDGSPTWLCDADVAEFLIFDRALSKDALRRLFAWAAGEPVPAVGNNMVQVSSRSYSGSCDCSQPAAETLYVDDDPANNRVTLYAYDYRNRLTAVDGEENFFEQRTYDNLDRVVQVDRRVGSSGGGLISRKKTYRDARGQVYKTEVFGADATSGDLTPPIVGLNWYDAAGNLAAAVAPGAKDLRTFTKTEFDGDGRVIGNYKAIYTGSLPITYSNAIKVTNFDRVFEQKTTELDQAGNVLQSAEYRRFPNSSAVNKLTSAVARISRHARWYDGLGRETAAANFGTSEYPRPSSPPRSTDSIPVSQYHYNTAGQPFESVDAIGRITRREFDAIGRIVVTVDNFTGCECPGRESDITVRQQFDADGHIVAITACSPDTGDQTTRYLYGAYLGKSAIASNALLASVTYPSVTGTFASVHYEYNRQGEQTRLTDQNQSVHDYHYDKRGRRTVDCVSKLGSSVDGFVRCLALTYNPRDQVIRQSSYRDAAMGTVANESQFTYNAFGQTLIEYQSHDGSVDVLTSPRVEYTYANGSQNSMRPTGLVYPGGRIIVFSYGVAGTDDDLLSRVSDIIDGETVVARYTYFGLAGVARAEYPEPALTYDLTFDGTSQNPFATCLDSFGRITQLHWRKSGASIAGSTYEYDRVNNRVRSYPLGYPLHARDEHYIFDSSQRLVRAFSTTETLFSAQETWSVDAIGNWSEYGEIEQQLIAPSQFQKRTYNALNEIVSIETLYGPPWVSPGYDRVGNTTRFPKPTDVSSPYDASYDAWNRLVAIRDGDSVVASYSYDGLFRRVKIVDAKGMRDCYYTVAWQLIEEVDGGESTQFIWGFRYVDDIILRDSSSGRKYALQDANWNVVAIAGDNGNILQRYRYSAYGKPTRLTSSGVADFALDSVAFEFRYCGYRYCDITCLHYARSRYLHSGLGVWLSPDPVNLSASSGQRAYLRSNPLGKTDPFGLFDFGEFLKSLLPNDRGCVQRKFDLYWLLGYYFGNLGGDWYVREFLDRFGSYLPKGFEGYAQFCKNFDRQPCNYSIAAGVRASWPIAQAWVFSVDFVADFGGTVTLDQAFNLQDGDIYFCGGLKGKAKINAWVAGLSAEASFRGCWSWQKGASAQLTYGGVFTTEGIFWSDSVSFSDRICWGGCGSIPSDLD
ncbi:MAG: hypothetical protein JNK76_00125, partial [Planctomycetales bacterium]|nr:hypothetical protein [Planctomycetales bacterium]